MKLVYSPEDGDSRSVTVFGHTFRAGEPVSVPGAVFDKLSGNPTFDTLDEATGAPAPKVDGRSRAARAAKAQDEAKTRAKAHAAELADAKGDADKDDD